MCNCRCEERLDAIDAEKRAADERWRETAREASKSLKESRHRMTAQLAEIGKQIEDNKRLIERQNKRIERRTEQMKRN